MMGNQTSMEHPSSSDSASKFADRLKTAIGGQSVRGIARDAGISEGALRSYLRGDTEPDVSALKRLANRLNRSVAWFVDDLQADEVLSTSGLEARENRPEWPAAAAQALSRVDDLARVIVTVDAFLAEARMHVSPEVKAQLIASLLEASNMSGGLDGLADNLKRTLDFLKPIREAS